MKTCEIKKLIKTGKKINTRHLTFFYDDIRSGDCVAIVKKAVGKAVERNKIKRRIRYLHRQLNAPNTVYILRTGAGIPDYNALKEEIEEKINETLKISDSQSICGIN